jgi:hypothetical protein
MSELGGFGLFLGEKGGRFLYIRKKEKKGGEGGRFLYIRKKKKRGEWWDSYI